MTAPARPSGRLSTANAGALGTFPPPLPRVACTRRDRWRTASGQKAIEGRAGAFSQLRAPDPTQATAG